jgi:uncharacterized protein
MIGPLELIVIQTVARCNLNCGYCYLSEIERKTSGCFPLDSVYSTFSKLFGSRFVSEAQPIWILWHAGEPLLLPVDYYRQFMSDANAARKNVGKQLTLRYSLQTNGINVNAVWCDFFKSENVEVGLSCDGPAFLHDACRKRWNGEDTHQQVMRAMALLKEFETDWHVLATVTPETLGFPDAFFDFFIEQKVASVGLNFVRQVASQKTNVMGRYLADVELFLRHLFARYIEHRKANPGNYLKIREFERSMDCLFNDGLTAEAAKNPLRMLSMDMNGNFSTYDPQLLTAQATQYPGGDFIIGNIFRDDLESVVQSVKFNKIYTDVSRGVDLCQQSCGYFELCHVCFPESKQGEHGTFLAMETVQCIIVTKIIGNIVLNYFQQRQVTNPP